MPSLRTPFPGLRFALALAALSGLGGCRSLPPGPLTLDRGLPLELPEPRASRKVLDSADAYGVEYSFQTYQGQTLRVRFEIDKKVYDAEDEGWGYRESELAALKAEREARRQAALDAARTGERTQAQLDEELAAVQVAYERKRREYVTSRGFALEAGGLVKVDLPALVRRGAPRLAAVARELERRARGEGRGVDWMIAAAASLVQTAIAYKDVPSVIDGRHTGGVWTPAKTLVAGWGDCDTKVALLGAILANWPGVRMIVLELPDHFLLGLAREPAEGESHLRWGGADWVLIEPSGPAWLPPGYLGDGTKALLSSGRAYAVEALP